jgi:RNA polymerase sigma-70 factor, ECF subfamily
MIPDTAPPAGAEPSPLAPQRPGAQVGSKTLDNEQAMEAFLAGVERRALRMAELATGDWQEALDIVQDAMLRMLRHYGQRPAEQWPPLFHRILQRRIIDWHRRRTLRRRLFGWLPAEAGDEADPMAAVPAPGPTPEQSVLDGEQGAAIEAALRRLPPRQQQAFLLRAWEGMDVRETAAAMGCSQGSVKTHYSRALQSLREQLGAPE